MRILYVVQRYGTDVVGGSESAARGFAERLARRGHHVEVVTSCATSYLDWADVHQPGTDELEGVLVHRLPVTAPRDLDRFARLNAWMVDGPRPIPMFVQQRWAREMGPDLRGYPSWLRGRAATFDLVVFMTYLYATTTTGLPAIAGTVPTLLQPTAHDEPSFDARLFDSLLRLPDGFVFFTPEERDLVARRLGREPLGQVVGFGFDVDHEPVSVPPSDPPTEPYLLYVGRPDVMKGAHELCEFVELYRRRRGPLGCVFTGDGGDLAAKHPDITFSGFVSDREKRALLAGSLALVLPSRFESFSIALCESWVEGRPALVHGDCEPLVGQARRSGGALPYRGYAEFETAVDLLREDRPMGDRLGAAGRRYVAQTYAWEVVLDRFELAAEAAIDHHRVSGGASPGRVHPD